MSAEGGEESGDECPGILRDGEFVTCEETEEGVSFDGRIAFFALEGR